MKDLILFSHDQRFIRMIPSLLKDDWQIHIHYAMEADLEHNQALIRHNKWQDFPLERVEMIIFPLEGIDHSRKIDFGRDSILLTDDFFSRLPRNCLLVSGKETEALLQISRTLSHKMIALFTADDLAIYNAIPTAEGALQIAMAETERTIHGANVYLLGFGRLGQTVGTLFQRVGANVTVYDKDRALLARAHSLHMQGTRELGIPSLGKMSLIMNTIPAPILTDDLLAAIHPDALIIDLASLPGAITENSTLIKKRQYIHALGLPAKVAPQTASQIVCRAILQAYENNKSGSL